MRKTWVGVDSNYQLATNWSPVGVPAVTDDLFFDDSGFTLCYSDTDIECAGIEFDAAATERVLFIGNNNICSGDFLQAGGIMNPGGTFDFQGNWTFISGEFTAVTPSTCLFSGTGKTYDADTKPTFYEVAVSGSITVLNGTSSPEFPIPRSLNNTGTITIDPGAVVEIEEANGKVTAWGTINGPGTLRCRLGANFTAPNAFSIDVGIFYIYVYEDVTFPTGTLGGIEANNMNIHFFVNNKVFKLDTGTLDVKGSVAFLGGTVITGFGEVDCRTNDAQFFVRGSYFRVHQKSFKTGTFRWKMGNGTHTMRCQVQFFFGNGVGGGTSNHLDVQADGSTLHLITHENIVYSHRLSLMKSAPSEEF